MRKLAIILLLSLILFGCISQKSYDVRITEAITNTQSFDLDKDGINDLIIYDFAPVAQNNFTLTRQVAAAAQTKSTYISFKNVDDVALLNIRADLDALDANQKLSLSGCAQNAGLKQDCTLLSSCSVLCGGSTKCKRELDKYQTIVPASMIEFVDDRNELDRALLDVRNSVLNLGSADAQAKGEYLNSLRNSVNRLARVYSNPIYNRGEIALCSIQEMDLGMVLGAADSVGSYSSVVERYDYYVTISVVGSDDAVSSVELNDAIPAQFIATADDISSEQKIGVEQNASNYEVEWTSDRSGSQGNMLGYRFSSQNTPQEIVPALSSPALAVNKLDMTFLGVTDFLFGMLYVISGNFFVALGSSIGLSLVIVFILYNTITIVLHGARAKVAGEGFLVGVRRALGRTEVRWKGDLVLGVLLLAAGYYISVFVVSEPAAPLTLLGAFSYFTSLALSMSAASGLAGVGLIFLSILLIYSSIENKLKITVLEQAYGVVIKEEEDLFQARVRRVKEGMKELQKLVEQYSAEEFDVSQEYDVLTSYSPQRIDELAKKMTARTKRVIEDDLTKIEGAIERLTERKKMADESWGKWSATIENMLVEQNEVYLTSLITVPASLRTWALRRYVKERGMEGIIFERDSIKKKHITPDTLLKSMIERKLIAGAVVLKKDKVLVAKMAQGSATVPSVLTLKLHAKLKALSKALGQHEPVSFATVGSKFVLVMMKTADLESMLIIPRENFKEAIEEFKKKAGMLD
jgi:hypothetical protein